MTIFVSVDFAHYNDLNDDHPAKMNWVTSDLPKFINIQPRTGETQNINNFSITVKRKASLQLPRTVRKIFAYPAGDSSTA